MCLGDALCFFTDFYIAIASLPFEVLDWGVRISNQLILLPVYSPSPFLWKHLALMSWNTDGPIIGTYKAQIQLMSLYIHVNLYLLFFSIVLASTCPVIEPLNFYLLQRGEVSGPQGALKSQGTSDIPCSGLISNIHVKHTTNTAPREILHKAPELWNVDFKSTPPSYCTWKQLGQKDPGFYILL